MGFFENWKVFKDCAEKQHLSTACQAAFYAIIGKFNDANWAEEIELTDSELMRLTQIRSSKTIADVKSRLKLSGLIDFRTSKHYGTTYKLVQLASAAWSEQQSKGHSKVQNKQQGKVQTEVPFINYTQNTEEKDVKTLRREENYTNSNSNAGAREAKSQISDELSRCWIENVGENPRGGVYVKLWESEQKYGTQKVVDAINKAAIHNTEPRLSFAYVLKIIENTLTKEGDKNGESNRPSASKDYKWELPPDLDKY